MICLKHRINHRASMEEVLARRLCRRWKDGTLIQGEDMGEEGIVQRINLCNQDGRCCRLDEGFEAGLCQVYL